MKKILLRAAAAFLGLAIGIMIFFPWNAAASAIFSFASKEAASRGIYLSCTSSESSGIFKKTFSYGGVSADLPVARLSLRDFSVKPDILSAIFSGKKSAHLTFGRGSFVPVTRQTLEWNGGTADVSANGGTILIENISVAGATSISGFAEISIAAQKIVRAQLLLKTPPELDRMFEMLRAANMLPLEKVSEGEWRITR